MQFPANVNMRQIADAIAPMFDTDDKSIVAVYVAIEGRNDLKMTRDAVAMWRTGGTVDQQGAVIVDGGAR